MYNNQNEPVWFPKSNGHIAWRWASKTIEAAAIEDLFWRKVQGSPTFAWEVVRTVWPDADRGKWDVLISPNLHVSLLPESCGAYTFGAWGDLSPLRGDVSDTRRIEMGEKRASKNGYYLGPLAALHKGWLDENVVANILGDMKSRLSASDRFRFHEKACHRQVLMTNINWDVCKTIIENAYPVMYNFLTWRAFWYRTETGDIIFGVIYYIDSNGNIHKLPISAWHKDTEVGRTHVYDLLHTAPPYPLYDLDRLVQYTGAKFALVCSSEAAVEYIVKYHAWLTKWMPVTTYCALEETDWRKLRGMTPIIFPEANEWGCHEAFRLCATLEKQGVKPLLIRRQKGSRLESKEAIQDLLSLSYDGGCTLATFAEHCQSEYNVRPPAGVLPKAVPLSALPEPACAPEPLMEGLLDAGELMMIYAWRGVGKSLFAMLLALCLASGKSALNGRICPTRKYKVLVLDAEMSSLNLKKRGRALCRGHGLPLETVDELKIRSSVVEKKALELETDAGFADLEPDMEAAEIIIVDSAFKFFPTSMSPEYAATQKLEECLAWARTHEKTLIVIDHEGKGRDTSFGSSGKENPLDVILRLSKTKAKGIQAFVQKVRNHADPTGPYLDMRIGVEEKGEKIAFLVEDENKGAAALEVESSGTAGEGEPTESSAEGAKSLDEAIKQFVSKHPDAAQGVIVTALKDRGYGGRSTIQARIKVLSEGGKLPAWQNRPRSHKVAEQPASEGEEK